MKNKTQEHILKAYVSSRFPRLVYEELSDMMLTFELIDNLAAEVLRGRTISRPCEDILTKQEKQKISTLLSSPNIDEVKRKELIFFYRLTLLVITILEAHF